jgi:hypothetical protein
MIKADYSSAQTILFALMNSVPTELLLMQLGLWTLQHICHKTTTPRLNGSHCRLAMPLHAKSRLRHGFGNDARQDSERTNKKDRAPHIRIRCCSQYLNQKSIDVCSLLFMMTQCDRVFCCYSDRHKGLCFSLRILATGCR